MSAVVAERVAKGTALLDENAPGWWQEVDLSRLVMSSGCNCVLGQVYGGFNVAVFRLLDDSWQASVTHGFNAETSGDEGGFFDDDDAAQWKAALDELDAEWRRVIEARRAGVQL